MMPPWGFSPLPHKRRTPPIAQIYAPRFPSDPIEIIGNEQGLERLINALIDAVTIGNCETEVSSSDGFESEVRAICLKGPRRPEEWSRSGSPYWDLDDPLVARILDLTEENRRLRDLLTALRTERKAIHHVEYHTAGEESGE